MSKALLDDLTWRGSIAQSTDRAELEKYLSSPGASLYLGFDPTAPSLHIGNLVALTLLRRFQLAGYKPIALVGGATGLVGDPSGRSAERSLNEADLVADWVERIRKQLEGFLDFTGKNAAIMANNFDWTAPVSAIEFLRDIGKHFSVNQMLARDSVASRLESGGISYTEFSYQVMQAFDYLELFRRHNCALQIGGSDQWGNIVAGVDLIRRVEAKSAHALTIPLLAKADGTKFGKTADGAIWLDPTMTSAYALFQFFLNSDDRDVEQLLKTFSFKSRKELEALFESLKTNPGAREAHRELAREVTTLLHGADQAQKVEAAAKALFGQGEIRDLDIETLKSALAELPKASINKAAEIPSWVDLVTSSGVVESKSAARRVIKEGGAYLNNEKITGEDFTPKSSDLLHGQFLLLRKGKRDLVAVEITE
ncbi:MAG: tyrosine--tRNA ligase [Actinobacteria bacterium BACL2 MAG-120802-bin41]|jgi:tyrosyl-tRNA synthetase|uniref:Tyrosine--tRNA ligase n=2 Tax=ac1 cluster TaxID=1655545 RepID=A0A0R2P2V4_9ACTN|nr:MAG: tyrosine--tRNA ligase [Actinobacteria bacterium BACL2 MAG-120802-bin41]